MKVCSSPSVEYINKDMNSGALALAALNESRAICFGLDLVTSGRPLPRCRRGRLLERRQDRRRRRRDALERTAVESADIEVLNGGLATIVIIVIAIVAAVALFPPPPAASSQRASPPQPPPRPPWRRRWRGWRFRWTRLPLRQPVGDTASC